MHRFSIKFLTSTALVAAGLCLAAASSHAQKSGDAMRGASLAETWCTACHIVDNKGTGTSVDPAPPFPLVANNPKKTPEHLQAWLSTSHPQMPNFHLGHREIADLIAYIASLRSGK